MKVRVHQSDLQQKLAEVRGAAPRRAYLPILHNIYAVVEDDHLLLTASDLKVTITARVPTISVERGGTFMIPAQTAYELVRSLPDAPIDMEVDEEQSGRSVLISSLRSSTNISYPDPADYPPAPKLGEVSASAVIPSHVLQEGIEKVIIAVAAQDSRPALACMKLEIRERDFTLAGADGFRMSIFEAPLDEPTDLGDLEQVDFLLERGIVSEIMRLAEREEDPIRVGIGDTYVLFCIGDTDLIGQRTNAEFPNYRQLIPERWDTRAVVQTDSFRQMVNSVSVFATDTSAAVRLYLDHNDDGMGSLRLRSATAEVGDNTGEIDARIDGDGNRIAFNARYLRELLRLLDGEMAVEMLSSSSPGVIRPTELHGADYTHVLMPLMVQAWD